MTPVPVLLVWLVLAASAGFPADDDSPDRLMKHGHWKRVRAIAQRQYAASPGDPHANYLMARVHLQWNDPATALPYAERAVKAAPQNAEYHWALAMILGEQAERASVFRQIGLARRFRSAVETVLTLQPNHVEAHYGMMLYYFKAPGIVGGDKKKSYAQAEALGRIDRAKGFQAQARLAHESQQPDRLPALYKACIEANPQEYECHTALLNIYANQNPRNVSAAESHAREAVRIAPDRISGYSGLAWAAAVQQRWADLDAVLAEGEKMVPDDFSPYYSAANALFNAGTDLPRAERYLRKYLSQEREAGRPTHAVAHWRLGLVYDKQGRKPEAIAALETAVRLDPSFEQAKKDLKRVKG